MAELKPITIYYSVQNGGDGSAYPDWFLTSKEAEYDQGTMSEGWGESCTGSIETFEGSATHKIAVKNSNQQYIQKNTTPASL